eukprot:5761437-Pleurochrysis_carterae.AAC.1
MPSFLRAALLDHERSAHTIAVSSRKEQCSSAMQIAAARTGHYRSRVECERVASTPSASAERRSGSSRRCCRRKADGSLLAWRRPPAEEIRMDELALITLHEFKQATVSEPLGLGLHLSSALGYIRAQPWATSELSLRLHPSSALGYIRA